MKIKTFFLIVCAAALFFSGCRKDDTFFAETEDNAVLKSAQVKEVPIKLIGNGYVTVTDYMVVDFLPAPNNLFPAKGISYGIMTHLGKLQAEKSTWTTTEIAPDPENEGFLLWTQEGDWCAANGDMLHWTTVGSVEFGAGKVSGRAEFDGGTGRFKNATGDFDLKGHVDPDNPTTRFIVDEGVGMISNVGSSKSDKNAWTYKTPMSMGRGFTSGAIVNNKIYVVGGFPTEFSVTSSMEMYDPAKDLWIPKADMPEGVCAHSACAYDGKIYVFGGVSPHPYAPATKNVFVYDPQSDKWTQKNDMPFENAFFGIAVLNDVIYLVGGMSSAVSEEPISTLMAYNPATDSWTEKAPMPTARGMLSASTVKGKIYAIGGTENFMSSSFDLVEVYDPAKDTWSTKTNMPTARVSPSTCEMKDKIYAVGGYTFPVMFALNEMYNPGADNWTTKSPMQETRQTCFLGSVGNKMYAIGGSYLDPILFVPVILSSVEEYDFSKD